jgi:flagellar motor component MotA
MGFVLTTLVVIGSDCIGSYKFNHHAITTTTVTVIWLACCSIILSDSGNTVIKAVHVLKDHYVKEENIILLNLFVTPQGKAKIHHD